MNIEEALNARANGKCELCEATQDLSAYLVPNSSDESVEENILACSTCQKDLSSPEQVDVNHWRCLNGSMWSEVPAVQVLAYRMLHHLKAEGWAQDLFDQIYLSDEALIWAKAGIAEVSDSVPTLDSNGTKLLEGDTITLIKDLVVKGANFTAKRGTLVKNITLTDNPEHIEGRVNGTQIVLVSKFLKKA